jgi:hypothetical protein
MVGVMPIGGIPLAVINCANFRASAKAQTCTLGLSPSVHDCLACGQRVPLVALEMPTAPTVRRRWRGLGDAVAALVRVLFLGRVDVARRIAATVEGAAATPGKPGVSGGCGCKRRQDALNRAIPFGKD